MNEYVKIYCCYAINIELHIYIHINNKNYIYIYIIIIELHIDHTRGDTYDSERITNRKNNNNLMQVCNNNIFIHLLILIFIMDLMEGVPKQARPSPPCWRGFLSKLFMTRASRGED